MNLGQYDKKNLQSIEKVLAEDASNTDTVERDAVDCISQEEAEQLSKWAEETLGMKAKKVRVSVLCTCSGIHPGRVEAAPPIELTASWI